MSSPTLLRASLARISVFLLAAPAALAQAPLAQLSPGPYGVGHYDWDFGEVAIADPFTGVELDVAHYGRMSYPAAGPGGTLAPVGVPTDGPGFPVVVFGHGRFFLDGTWQTNHLQVGYLMDRLASHGIVATSVNLGVVGSYEPGIEQRSTILLETLERTLAFDPFPGHAPEGLADVLDRDRLGLMGHSRGGEGAIGAALANLASAAPLPVLAVATIAPTDFEGYTLPAELPSMSLYGSKDGDVDNGWPIQLHDRSLSEERVFEYIFGANHFFFTESLTCSCEGAADIPRALHHKIAEGYLGGFMARKLAQTPLPARVFADGVELAPVTTQATILPQYRDPERLTLEDFEGGAAGGAAGAFGFAYALDDVSLDASGFTYYHDTRGFVGGWDRFVPAWLAAVPSGVDAGQWSFLSVQFAQRFGAPGNRAGQSQDVTLVMVDLDGDQAAVPLSDYGDIPPPPNHPGGLFLVFPKKSVLRTTRVPIAAFEAANPDFDPAAVAFIGWRADRTPAGELAFDRLELTQ